MAILPDAPAKRQDARRAPTRFCDDDLIAIAHRMLGIAPNPGVQVTGVGDLDGGRNQIGSATDLYAGADDISLGAARIAFASLPNANLIVRTLDPFRAHLVRRDLNMSNEQAVTAVWSRLSAEHQKALALLEQAIFLSKREYLEQMISEHPRADLLTTWENAGWVSAKGSGFYFVVDDLRAQMDSTDGLLDDARGHWLRVLVALQGYCDLDLDRCVHLFSAGQREQAVEVAHTTLLSVEDPFFLRLLGAWLSKIDVAKVRRHLSPHHRLLLDDAIGIHDLRVGRYPEVITKA